MEQVKLIAVTVVVTVLIWTTADQLLSDTVEVEVTVEPLPAAGTGMMVDTDPPGQNRFKMILSGPKRVVEEVRREGGLRVTIPIPDLPSGSRRIDVKEGLTDYPEQFRGLRVEAVDPPAINLLVDHLQTVTMPVHVERGDLEYEVPPKVEPSEVAVTIPELALDGFRPRGNSAWCWMSRTCSAAGPRGSPSGFQASRCRPGSARSRSPWNRTR